MESGIRGGEDRGLIRAEIDLSAIAHNVRELRRITAPGSRFMAVVKADAYGHGAAEVARRALESGADMLGVARLNEGVRLRDAGIHAPILVFGHTPPDEVRKILASDLTQTVFDDETAIRLSESAMSEGKRIAVHIKADTGMGRLGMAAGTREDVENAAKQIRRMAALPGIDIQGIYTHFAASDSSDKSFARRQFEMFSELLDNLRRKGPDIPLRHAANSAAIIDLPETHLDMVRAGISLYGLYPSDEVDRSRAALRPAMSLKADIVHLKEVPAGFKVSYGMTYEASKPTRIATVPVGYADGISRLLSSRGHMLVRGQKAPIAGRVCMDATMLDVGRIPDVRVGDEVVILGRQGDEKITADQIAAILGTINYEVVSSVMARVPRVWLR